MERADDAKKCHIDVIAISESSAADECGTDDGKRTIRRSFLYRGQAMLYRSILSQSSSLLPF